MKFLCDHMLGTLAKWLRFLGYDTAYPADQKDDELIAMAVAEDRVLLTRDKELAGRCDKALLLTTDDGEAQLGVVVKAFHLTAAEALTRCSVCNATLQAAGIEEVRAEVPPGVQETHREFWRCPTCRRVYWKGSHYDRMVARIREVTAGS